ncbi:hypothetical protein SGPA1_10968 [Streptomyces misionensis JCM 4497]
MVAITGAHRQSREGRHDHRRQQRPAARGAGRPQRARAEVLPDQAAVARHDRRAATRLRGTGGTAARRAVRHVPDHRAPGAPGTGRRGTAGPDPGQGHLRGAAEAVPHAPTDLAHRGHAGAGAGTGLPGPRRRGGAGGRAAGGAAGHRGRGARAADRAAAAGQRGADGDRDDASVGPALSRAARRTGLLPLAVHRARGGLRGAAVVGRRDDRDVLVDASGGGVAGDRRGAADAAAVAALAGRGGFAGGVGAGGLPRFAVQVRGHAAPAPADDTRTPGLGPLVWTGPDRRW